MGVVAAVSSSSSCSSSSLVSDDDVVYLPLSYRLKVLFNASSNSSSACSTVEVGGTDGCGCGCGADDWNDCTVDDRNRLIKS